MAKIKIFMAGGRRCGKSTILYNMQKEMRQVLRHGPNDTTPTDLFNLVLDKNNIVKITRAQEFLTDLFSGDNGYSRYCDFPGDDVPDKDRTIVKMHLRPTSIPRESLTLEFTDVPGEWFDGICSAEPTTGEQKFNICVDLMRDSDVIILAIDTPSMVEANGRYFEYFNRYENISNALRTAISDGDSNKLVLFVPLKCEKYLIDPSNGREIEGGKQKVTDTVKQRYGELISFLTEPVMSQRITVAITPISTIREIHWSRFKLFDNKGGELRVYDEETGLPVTIRKDDANKLLTSFYSFNDALYDDALEDGTTSKYCEQPLVYTLTYALKLSQSKQGFLSSLFRAQRHYGEEIERLRRRVMKRQNGFEIISNPFAI